MQNSGFELLVEVNGKPIPEYGSKGRTYVEGRRDTRYDLRFRNSRAERVLVVPTVDNLSVLDGNPYHENSTGYVIPAYSSITIKGWRTSYSEVHAFRFKDRSGSYSEKTGSGTGNCGVIGTRVYAEVRPCVYPQVLHVPTVWVTNPITYYPAATWELRCATGISPGVESLSSSAYDCLNQQGHSGMMAAQNMAESAPDFNLGTGFGESVNDSVSTTHFERGSCLAQFEIFYSDRDGLIKDGIQVDKRPSVATFPQAFGGFCKIPS